MIYLIPAILWTLVISFLFLIPGDKIPAYEVFSYDKLGHLVFFAIFIYLWLWGITYKDKSVNYLKISYIVLFCGIGYVAWIEVVQLFLIPGRTGDIGDFLAGMVGCLVGYGIFFRMGLFLKN